MNETLRTELPKLAFDDIPKPNADAVSLHSVILHNYDNYNTVFYIRQSRLLSYFPYNFSPTSHNKRSRKEHVYERNITNRITKTRF